jgi:hypothetical protein
LYKQDSAEGLLLVNFDLVISSPNAVISKINEMFKLSLELFIDEREIMGIPVISPTVLVESVSKNPSAIIEYIQNSMLNYDHKRGLLGQVFKKYIEDNGFAISNSLRSFVTERSVK